MQSPVELKSRANVSTLQSSVFIRVDLKSQRIASYILEGSGGHFAKYLGGGGGIFNMYAFGVHLRYANLSNIMLGISYSFLIYYCNVTITLYAYILVCFLCSTCF